MVIEADRYEGEATPLVTDALVTKVKGNFALLTEAAGGITLLEATKEHGETIEVTFQHHVLDVHYDRTHVTSTSDSVGLWVGISEDSATSNRFGGHVYLSTARIENAVYVRPCDAVSFVYYDSARLKVASDSVNVPGNCAPKLPLPPPTPIPTPMPERRIEIPEMKVEMLCRMMEKVEGSPCPTETP